MVLLGLSLVTMNTVRREIDRVALPDDRVVMLSLEPGMTDAVYGLWEQQGRHWRPLFASASEITYSEDGSFTDDPGLVLSADGRHLLIRRGGLFTDCWVLRARPEACLGEAGSGLPRERADWIERSARIAAIVGTEPSPP